VGRGILQVDIHKVAATFRNQVEDLAELERVWAVVNLDG